MREILVDITQNFNCTVLISSHILGELEKIATHYGIIREGKMIQELTAKEMESRARVFVSFKVNETAKAITLLKKKYNNVREEQEYVRVYDEEDVDGIVKYLLDNNIILSEIKKNKVGLEEYYIELMSGQEVK